MGLSVSSSHSAIDFTIEHCQILSYRGKAINLYATANSNLTFTLHDTTIQGSYQWPTSESWPGAGVSATSYDGSQLDVTMTNNNIIDNQALTGGGLYFYVSDATLNGTLKNNILAGNESNGGGAIQAVAGGTGTMELILTNNTISNNIAPTKGVGISLYSAQTAAITAFLKNTIVWENGTDISMEEMESSTISLMADYSIVGEVNNVAGGTYTDKSSNIHVDPLLTTNYHLSSGSPAKDTGVCGLVGIILPIYSRIAPYDDIDGDARPGDGIKFGCDIGADEYRFSWTLFNPAFIRQ